MTKGFTLIEVLAAAFMITLGAGGAFALMQQTLAFTSIAVSQLEASYLAQEGAEIARSIRDSNLLQIHKGLGGNWDDGLTGCETGCGAGSQELALTPGKQDQLLNIDGAGFYYTYDAGTPTSFKRTMTITPQGADQLDVFVEVTWEERGRTHRVETATELYNWLPTAP